MKTLNTFKNVSEYNTAREQLNAYNEATMKYCKENKTNGIPCEITKTFPFADIVTNDLRSKIESWEFINDKPEKYFIYINQKFTKMETTEYNNQAEDFLKATGTTFKSVYKDHDFYFDGDKETRDIYRITLKNDKHRFSFNFGQAIAKCGRHPTPYDVLACLTKSDPGTFKNFCYEFGYEEDSRKAYKIYKAVMKEYKNIELLFTEEEIEQLQEIN